jgi:DNA-binding GntR family transcriptional regulator
MTTCAHAAPHLPALLGAGETRLSAEQIYPRLFDAILEQRLPPGSALPEQALGNAFGVSRTVIRRVLGRLSDQQVIVQRPSHTAHLAAPDPEQARQVLSARRLAETTLIGLATQRARPAQIRQLRQLVERERQHHEQGERCTAIRLGGEFHMKLAQMAANAPLARFLNGLVPMTSLIIARYESPCCEHCAWQEHAAIIDAVESGDGGAALALMHEHLDHLEAKLDLEWVEGPLGERRCSPRRSAAAMGSTHKEPLYRPILENHPSLYQGGGRVKSLALLLLCLLLALGGCASNAPCPAATAILPPPPGNASTRT